MSMRNLLLNGFGKRFTDHQIGGDPDVCSIPDDIR